MGISSRGCDHCGAEDSRRQELDGAWVCMICGRSTGTASPLPLVPNRALDVENQWSARSGYQGVSATAVALSISVRTVWNRVSELGLPYGSETGHTVFDLQQVEEIKDYNIEFRDGERVKAWTGTLAQESGYGSRWINEGVRTGAISGGKERGRLFAYREAFSEYLDQPGRRGPRPGQGGRRPREAGNTIFALELRDGEFVKV